MICKYPNCERECYIENGRVHDFCGRTHARASRHPTLCRYPKCNKWVRPKPTPPYGFYDFCGRNHALEFAELNSSAASHQNSATLDVKLDVSLSEFVLELISKKEIALAPHDPKKPPQAYNQTGEIKFYKKGEPYYEFTNFYERGFKLDGLSWKTSEHYFQAQKFVDKNCLIGQNVKDQPSAREAFQIARKNDGLKRADWESAKVDIMKTCLKAKFTQNKDLEALLVGTGNAKLIEHTSNDKYWGDGDDGSGQNMLGRLLMELREELKKNKLS